MDFQFLLYGNSFHSILDQVFKMSPFSPVSWKYWLLNAKNSLFLLKLGWYLVTVVNFPFQSKMRAWRQFSADVSTFPSIFRTFYHESDISQ